MYIYESIYKLYYLCVIIEKFCCNFFIEFYVYEYGIVLKLILFYKNFLYGLIDMFLNVMFGNFEIMYCYIYCRRFFLDISIGSKNFFKGLIIIFFYLLL